MIENEPTEIQAGDSVSWTRSGGSYPASDGWLLKYAFRGPSPQDFESVPDGDDHKISLTSAQTTIKAGVYQVQGFFVRDEDRKTVFNGRIVVLADLAADPDFDGRSFAEKTLEAIEAVLAGSASRSQKTQKYDDVELEYLTLKELMDARNRLRAEVRREKDKADRAAGKPSRRIIRTISRGN